MVGHFSLSWSLLGSNPLNEEVFQLYPSDQGNLARQGQTLRFIAYFTTGGVSQSSPGGCVRGGV